MTLSLPQSLHTREGQPVACRRLLGEGGQGRVFEVTVDGAAHALKLYHPHMAPAAQRGMIERAVQAGPPSAHFLWPTHVVSGPGDAFGYLMPLRPARFRSVPDLVTRRVTSTFPAILTAAAELASAFHDLHAKGLAYCDISWGNVFLDPRSGEVLVCDNDNVDVDGAETATVLGTPRFMAPEIVRGEAGPSVRTDRFSLAVLLFQMLFNGHPLEGAREAKVRCLDGPALEQLYGTRPLYVFDPTDPANRPVKGIHDNVLIFQKIWPSPLRRMFEIAFTVGLTSPGRRPTEREWQRALLSTRDLLHPCGACGHPNALDAAALRAGDAGRCWSCGGAVGPVTWLDLKDAAVALPVGGALYPHHLGERNDFGAVAAQVEAHPEDARRRGLRNRTQAAWSLTRPDGALVPVPPGRAAALEPDYTLDFGQARGRVHRTR